MAWMIKYDQLDDDQKDFVDKEINKTGNIWIKGFAGSGKSVMLIHALRKKLEDSPNARMCVVVYTRSLIDMFKTGMNELGMPTIPVMTYHQFKKGSDNYDYIFCDEVQDLPEHVLVNMQQRSQHVYVAGDSNQSIYDNTVSPNEIGNVIGARPFELTRIYRLSSSIINAVARLLPNMNIFSARRNMQDVKVDVRLVKAYDEEEEVKYIWEKASEYTAERYNTVVLLPKRDDIIKFANILLEQNGKQPWEVVKDAWDERPDWGQLNQHFKANNLNVEYIGNGYGSFQNAEKRGNLILMTYHSAKGMDFYNVFLPFLSDDLFIRKYDEETLFMVAMTRSRINLFITYSGFLNDLVTRFESICSKIDLTETTGNDAIDDDIDF